MNDNADLFNIKQPQPDPQQGGLLISEPILDEIYFQRACVLLVDYLPDFPTTGLVLNKRINLNLNDVIPELKIDKKIPLYCGGPLSLDRLFFIHNIPEIPKSHQVSENLFFNGDFDAVVDYLNSNPKEEPLFKFFLGYSGWERSQLKEEIDSHVWAVFNHRLPTETLLQPNNNLWEELVSELGEAYRNWLLCPIYPFEN